MREIKFRAWDKDEKRMLVSSFGGNYISFGGSVHNGSIKKNYVLMQHTGLKDKYKREVYEGSVYVGANGNKYVIEFISGAFMLVNVKDDDDQLDAVEVQYMWCLGDRYHNPELLEQ
jgi:hypothetical protein